MFLPTGYNEKQILEIIEKIVGILASKFRFGYFDIDDIKQQGRLFAIEALPRFDADRNHTLDNFLYRHVRNRLVNYKRDNYMRREFPCLSCPFYDPKNLKSTNSCAVFSDKMECTKWSNWINKNESKRNLVELAQESNQPAHNKNTTDALDDAAFKEMKDLIDAKLDVELRADYLRLLGGTSIPKPRKDRIRAAILDIIGENTN